MEKGAENDTNITKGTGWLPHLLEQQNMSKNDERMERKRGMFGEKVYTTIY